MQIGVPGGRLVQQSLYHLPDWVTTAIVRGTSIKGAPRPAAGVPDRFLPTGMSTAFATIAKNVRLKCQMPKSKLTGLDIRFNLRSFETLNLTDLHFII